jgi:hypothetical protein
MVLMPEPVLVVMNVSVVVAVAADVVEAIVPATERASSLVVVPILRVSVDVEDVEVDAKVVTELNELARVRKNLVTWREAALVAGGAVSRGAMLEVWGGELRVSVVGIINKPGQRKREASVAHHSDMR